MPQPDAPNSGRRDGQGLLTQFVRDAGLPPDDRLFHLRGDAILQERLLSRNLLEGRLATSVVELFESIETIAALPHQLAGF